jgi:hypothetical protein
MCKSKRKLCNSKQKYFIFIISDSFTVTPLTAEEFIKDVRDTDFCAKAMSFVCNSSKVQEVWIRVRLYGMEGQLSLEGQLSPL